MTGDLERRSGQGPGYPLRRALLLAAVAAVVLPLLVVTTALTGFAEVRGAHANATRLLTAQQYQQDADMMHDAIYADVLAAVAGPAGATESAHRVDQKVHTHAAQLESDLRRLDSFTLPAAVKADLAQLQPALRAYATQAVELVDLAARDTPAAHGQLPAFRTNFSSLEGPQAALTMTLAQHAADQSAAADRRQRLAVRSTAVVATATLGALLCLAFFLYRLGGRNEMLLSRLEENGEQLARSNDQLEAAQRLAHVGSWEWDPATGDTKWSPEFYRILGLAPDTLGSHQATFARRVHPEDRARVERARLEAARGEGDVSSRYRIVRPDGTVRDVLANGQVVHVGSGEKVRLIGTIQDITEHRSIERMKDEIISVVSHELRTPLTSVLGAIELIAGGSVGPLPVKAQRMADVALNSCERLVRLVTDVLDVEKISAGMLELDLEPLAATDVVAAAIEEMRSMSEQAGVTVVAMPMDVRVVADRDRVAQLLTNLLSNAVKFSASGGSVIVSAGPAASEDGLGEMVQFTVTDQGSGIPPDKLEAVFDRFAQVDASDIRAKGGTGLGLPICRGIVEQHGGRIWATSEPGLGTTLAFTLPAVPAPGEDDRVGPLPVGAVLICDDDPDVVEVLAAMLEAHGYPTLRAHSGREALALAAGQAPSLVLVDLKMPGMSGWETIAGLGADPATAEIPVVILSALAPDDIAVPSASSWLTKPVDQAALIATLRSVLGPGQTTSVLVVEDDAGLAEVLQAFFTDHGVYARVAHTGRQALAMSSDIPPDLLVLDLGLPDIDGYTVVAALRRDDRLRSLPLIVFTGSQLDDADRDRLRLGETRFVTKANVSPDGFEAQVISLLHSITNQ